MSPDGSAFPMTPGAGDATQGAKDGEPGTPSDSPPPDFVTVGNTPLSTLPVPPDADQYVPRSGPEGGVCAICGRPPKTRKLHVDHDHKTGKVRGLLCYTCNRFILGRYATPAKLRAAADYLERNAG